ncbi:B94 [miniopterid betaherpesvirus 1]|uniref:B94 n=1 Tax=miniopterid betaherpesvirus 1 TaxID=3070189 RepID=I3VQ87_9BETA|nr:B94 [miniopterid betaherpesvirus 1]AFK83931.1 B94 [miniopterid betaherpesvirus 1]
MASSLTQSVTDLRCVKQFLEQECVWRLVAKELRFREYIAVCSASPTFCPESPRDDKKHVCCQLLLLRNEKGYVFCLSVNGRHLGQFICGTVTRRRYALPGMPDYYTLSFPSVLVPTSLGILPILTTPSNLIGAPSMAPGLLYEHCSLVTPDEANSLLLKGSGGKVVSRLGGVGAWALYDGDEIVLYAFVLAFDLFTAFCDRNWFPSLAYMFSRSVLCDDVKCIFCTDNGKHVDPMAGFVGCKPDEGLCMCYAPCRSPIAEITCDDHVPFLTDSDDAAFLMTKTRTATAVGVDVDAHIGVMDRDGRELPVKTAAWTLVKWDPYISRLLVLSCPIMKRLTLCP